MRRSKILTRAWQLVKVGYSFSDAQKLAWKTARIQTKMKQGPILITFKKGDGSQTTKAATLSPDYLPAPKAKSGKPKKRVSPKVTFWSIQDNGFRSFLPQNLISTSEVAA